MNGKCWTKVCEARSGLNGGNDMVGKVMNKQVMDMTKFGKAMMDSVRSVWVNKTCDPRSKVLEHCKRVVYV